MKYLITISLFLTSLQASDITNCSTFSSEGACRSNHCSWLSGAGRCSGSSSGNHFRHKNHTKHKAGSKIKKFHHGGRKSTHHGRRMGGRRR